MTRLGTHLQSVGLAEQSGFMPSHGCVDATATLKIALQAGSMCYVRRLEENFRLSQ